MGRATVTFQRRAHLGTRVHWILLIEQGFMKQRQGHNTILDSVE